jgi:hypothetical protein
MRYLSDLCRDQIVELLFHTVPYPLAAMSSEYKEQFVWALYDCIDREIERAVRDERARWRVGSEN